MVQVLVGRIAVPARRFIFEPEVAAMAPAIVEAYEDKQPNDHQEAEAIRADILFHRRLVEACHSQPLHSLVEQCLWRRGHILSCPSKIGGLIRDLDEHGQVADAVHPNNPEAASRAPMLRILTTNAEGIELIRRRRPRRSGLPRRPWRARVRQ
jgi:DNA-binding FadR family transcriptional regulator